MYALLKYFRDQTSRQQYCRVVVTVTPRPLSVVGAVFKRKDPLLPHDPPPAWYPSPHTFIPNSPHRYHNSFAHSKLNAVVRKTFFFRERKIILKKCFVKLNNNNYLLMGFILWRVERTEQVSSVWPNDCSYWTVLQHREVMDGCALPLQL